MSSDLTEGDCVNTGFSFDENTTAYLGELQKTGRLPHAIIIESPDVQKGMDLAVYLSMFAVCSGEEKPCGACKNCQNARSKAHSDIFYPQLQPKKKAYQVEQMRDLIKDAYILPNEADAKVYIFEDCDARFTELVQNTFLKLFEEPPQNVHFILLCKTAQTFLPTVLSRFTIIRIRGSEQLDEAYIQIAKAIADGITDSKEYPLLKALNALNDKETADKTIAAFRLLLRDALVLLSGGEPLGDRESAKSLAGRLTRKKILEMMDLCGSADYMIQQNANSNLLATWMCGELRRITWQR